MLSTLFVTFHLIRFRILIVSMFLLFLFSILSVNFISHTAKLFSLSLFSILMSDYESLATILCSRALITFSSVSSSFSDLRCAQVLSFSILRQHICTQREILNLNSLFWTNHFSLHCTLSSFPSIQNPLSRSLTLRIANWDWKILQVEFLFSILWEKLPFPIRYSQFIIIAQEYEECLLENGELRM